MIHFALEANEIIDQDNMKEDEVVLNDADAADYDYVSDEEKDILKKQFRAADFDSNKLLSQSEITMAISRETKKHILVSSQQDKT